MSRRTRNYCHKSIPRIFGEYYLDEIKKGIENPTHKFIIDLVKAGVLKFDLSLFIRYKCASIHGLFFIDKNSAVFLDMNIAHMVYRSISNECLACDEFHPKKNRRCLAEAYHRTIYRESRTKSKLPSNIYEFINDYVKSSGILKVVLELNLVNPNFSLLKGGIITTIEDCDLVKKYIRNNMYFHHAVLDKKNELLKAQSVTL